MPSPQKTDPVLDVLVAVGDQYVIDKYIRTLKDLDFASKEIESLQDLISTFSAEINTLSACANDRVIKLTKTEFDRLATMGTLVTDSVDEIYIVQKYGTQYYGAMLLLCVGEREVDITDYSA